ncbi:MAG: hypothetical protein GXO48_04075 [Chlorobi bacterium]|nr:hypothetical protein [Chlorobiota bacterium]
MKIKVGRDESAKPSVIVSGGDPLGVGPYLIAFALQKSLFPENTWIVISREIVDYWFKELYGQALHTLGSIKIIDVPLGGDWQEPATAGHISFKYLSKATESAKICQVPLLTLPINKERWEKAGISFPGHTEFFRHVFPNADPIMAMKHKDLFVVAITDHIPLRKVIDFFNQREWVESRLRNIISELVKFSNIRKIAITGLNPHAGETPSLGIEEATVLKPFIGKLKEEFPTLRIEGPFPADSFWGMGKWKDFDVVLAPYHDQAFVPFKLLVEGKKGVHITLGLPFLRVSPIHGTAEEAVKSRNVNVDSFVECIDLLKKHTTTSNRNQLR